MINNKLIENFYSASVLVFHMLIIKCSKCKRKIYKYVKIGKGQLIRCWKNRIVEDNCIVEGKIIKCACGNIIGTDEGNFIKIKSSAIIISGTKQ